MTSAEDRRILAEIDREYTPVGCLGHGGFGSVFLAKKKSGRKVALKFMLMDTDDDDQYDTFIRELGAVVKLNNDTDSSGKDLAIVYFQDFFIGRGFACIVMNYADGGTLLQEIERKSKKCHPSSSAQVEPYSERRIAWYALQLCEALAYAHERGVAHHDVKAANVLIDASAGGKLLLADFGTSIAPGEESVGFTKSYAPPELLASHELEDYADLRPDKIDSFGLGCILYELLICSKLEELSDDQTLAEFITDGPGLEAAMTLGCMRLPWLPPSGCSSPLSSSNYVGYTYALKCLIMNLLKPNPEERWLPNQLQNPLRKDPLSPLLTPNTVAAQTPEPGTPVTIDNAQLGMFVQRGLDWDDADADGGIGSVGVVVKLDADATYTEVAFPSRSPETTSVDSICCRIGAGNKYELQVGPTPVSDYCSGSTGMRWNGIISTQDASNFSLGQRINQNCVIVGVDTCRGLVLATPMEQIIVPSLPKRRPWSTNNTSFAAPCEQARPPSSWQPELGLHAQVLDAQERSDVLRLFYKKSGGLREEEYAVESIQRIQDTRLWESYARQREVIATENWGIVNETQAFICLGVPLEGITSASMQNFQSTGKQLSEKASIVHDACNAKAARGRLQMMLACVALGRVDANEIGNTPGISSTKYHSAMMEMERIECRGPSQVYPQYIITYRDRGITPVQRRIVQAVRPPSANIPTAPNAKSASYQSAIAAAQQKLKGKEGGGRRENARAGPSPTKQCVLCCENPVRHLLVPCGHVCLCDRCCSPATLRKLKGKCPECRDTFREAAKIFGRVVNDDA